MCKFQSFALPHFTLSREISPALRAFRLCNNIPTPSHSKAPRFSYFNCSALPCSLFIHSALCPFLLSLKGFSYFSQLFFTLCQDSKYPFLSNIFHPLLSSPLIPSQIQISYFATYPFRFNCDEQHICLSLVHIFQHNFSTAKFTSGDFRNPLIPAESLHIYFAYIGLCIDNFCARRPAGWHIQWFDGRANFSLVYIFINLLL